VLGEAVTRAEAEGRALAVHFIDLDRFKPVNDSFGHDRGDALLRAVADRLACACSSVGVASRIGGDEFIVLQTEVADDLAAAHFGQALCDALAEVGAPLGVSASVGMAMYPKDGATAEDVVRNADLALYDAKAAGRAVFRCFDMSSAERMREHQALIHDLRATVEAGGFHLVYQPQARTRDAEIEGFEALIRWTHPKLGPIGPDRFIPMAEEAGVIGPIGAWVLETACREAASWSAPLCIAVNLSPCQILSGGLPDLVAKVLADTGLEPSRLELEITEGIFIKDTQQTVETLNALKAMGVRIAMDDFGTGYSSLSYLQAFAFDRIKIDRSFISNLETSTHSRAIVKAVTSIGRALGVPVLAEGVETDAQRVLLVAEGCTEFQGYLLGRPAAIETFAALTAPGSEIARKIA
jgi:diguanylate cyclase (GGDEF)-like protein